MLRRTEDWRSAAGLLAKYVGFEAPKYIWGTNNAKYKSKLSFVVGLLGGGAEGSGLRTSETND